VKGKRWFIVLRLLSTEANVKRENERQVFALSQFYNMKGEEEEHCHAA
jgi:hypothetical protein